jgi:hypothetical protein
MAIPIWAGHARWICVGGYLTGAVGIGSFAMNLKKWFSESKAAKHAKLVKDCALILTIKADVDREILQSGDAPFSEDRLRAYLEKYGHPELLMEAIDSLARGGRAEKTCLPHYWIIR